MLRPLGRIQLADQIEIYTASMLKSDLTLDSLLFLACVMNSSNWCCKCDSKAPGLWDVSQYMGSRACEKSLQYVAETNPLTDDMLCSGKLITYGYTMGSRLTSDHAVLLQVPKELFGCFAVPCFTRNQEGTNYYPPTYIDTNKFASVWA